jgi:hypothetical protein
LNLKEKIGSIPDEHPAINDIVPVGAIVVTVPFLLPNTISPLIFANSSETLIASEDIKDIICPAISIAFSELYDIPNY